MFWGCNELQKAGRWKQDDKNSYCGLCFGLRCTGTLSLPFWQFLACQYDSTGRAIVEG